MIILIIVFVLAVMLMAFMSGCVAGYGQGYEMHMLEGMSNKEKEAYLLKKNAMQSRTNKHSQYDI